MITYTSDNGYRLGVIGAGPSGLAVSLFLTDTPEILEMNQHVGGHTSSFTLNGFTFDFGPHILFSRDQEILDFVVNSLGENVVQCRRHNKIAYKGRLLKYPFENDLHSLPLEDNYECLSHFLFNPYQKQYPSPKNMKEWFLKTFGQGICERYLFPYNEKVWNIPVEELAMSLACRIPNPPPEDIVKSSLGYSTEGYLHQLYYHYPKSGGYQAICEAWKKDLPITYQFCVKKIQFKDNKIRVFDQNGRMKEYFQVISTMPIDELISVLDIPIPDEIQKAVNQLTINPMFVISFGIRGVDPNQYTAIYFPEPEFWVNRVSFPATFSKTNAPDGHFSLQAEITCTKTSEIWKQSDEAILLHTKHGLQARHLLPSDDAIVVAEVKRVSHAYVVYDVHYEENASIVRAWFASLGIHLLGRFSYFEYINVDMAVMRALELATLLNRHGMKVNPTLKTTYLNKALRSHSCPISS